MNVKRQVATTGAINTSAPLRTMRDNRLREFLLVTALTGAMRLFCFVMLREEENGGVDEASRVAPRIMFGVMVPSTAVWNCLCYSCRPEPNAA